MPTQIMWKSRIDSTRCFAVTYVEGTVVSDIVLDTGAGRALVSGAQVETVGKERDGGVRTG